MMRAASGAVLGVLPPTKVRAVHHPIRSSSLLALLACAAVLLAAGAAHAQAPSVPLRFFGDHHVVGESGQDRRAVYGDTEAGATLRFYRVDKAAPPASCTGTPLAVAVADPDGRWDVVLDFDGIAFVQVTGASATSACRPVFLSSLPIFGSAGTRAGTAITFVHPQLRSNPTGDAWPTALDYVSTTLTTSEIGSYQAQPARINVGGIVLEAADFPYRDLANLRFGTSYTKLHSLGSDPLGAFTGRTEDTVYGHTTFAFMRLRVFAGAGCDPDRLLATAYADDRGQWALPLAAQAAGTVSVATDFGGAEPTPSDAVPLSAHLDSWTRSSSPYAACSGELGPAPAAQPAAPAGARLVPDPSAPAGATVRAAVPDAGKGWVPDRIGAYAARDAACTGTGAFLGSTSTREQFAADGVRLDDRSSLDLDRVGVRLWHNGVPSPCAPAIAPAERTLSLALGAERATAADAVPVRLSVANAGPWPTVATTVRVTADRGVVLGPAAGDRSCARDGDDLVCAVPAIASGSTRDVHAIATVGAAGTTAIAATLAPHRRDTDGTDDSARATVQVAPRPVGAAPAPRPAAPAAAPPVVCRSRRAFALTVDAPPTRIRRVVVRLDGRPLPTVRRRGRVTATIDLRGRAAGTATVIVKRTPVRGRSTYETRRYRICAR